jgi:hypothetical protein
MGCQQSNTAGPPAKGTIKGVGQTERMVSRAHRVEQKLRQKEQPSSKANSTASNTSVASTAAGSATAGGSGPKLNSIGQLMPEEVVRRTHSSILTESMTLGTAGSGIKLEVGGCRSSGLMMRVSVTLLKA